MSTKNQRIEDLVKQMEEKSRHILEKFKASEEDRKLAENYGATIRKDQNICIRIKSEKITENSNKVTSKIESIHGNLSENQRKSFNQTSEFGRNNFRKYAECNTSEEHKAYLDYMHFQRTRFNNKNFQINNFNGCQNNCHNYVDDYKIVNATYQDFKRLHNPNLKNKLPKRIEQDKYNNNKISNDQNFHSQNYLNSKTSPNHNSFIQNKSELSIEHTECQNTFTEKPFQKSKNSSDFNYNSIESQSKVEEKLPENVIQEPKKVDNPTIDKDIKTKSKSSISDEEFIDDALEDLDQYMLKVDMEQFVVIDPESPQPILAMPLKPWTNDILSEIEINKIEDVKENGIISDNNIDLGNPFVLQEGVSNLIKTNNDSTELLEKECSNKSTNSIPEEVCEDRNLINDMSVSPQINENLIQCLKKPTDSIESDCKITTNCSIESCQTSSNTEIGNFDQPLPEEKIKEDDKWIDRIEAHERPDVYYKVLNYIIPKSQGKIHYSDNLSIPNYLRISDAEMELHLINIQELEEIALQSLSSIDNGMVFLHLVEHAVKLQIGDDVINIPQTSSWQIKNTIDMKVISFHENTKLVIEIIKISTSDSDPRDEPKQEELTDILYHPKKVDFRTRKSFLKKPMNLDEIRKKLIFIDAEFTVEGVSKWKTPLSVCILNYRGEILLNKYITPRNRIIDFGTMFHGIKEKQTRNKWDEYKVIKEIQVICEQKIIVGHDLQLELGHLGISKKRIYGIRDLVAAPVFKNMGIFPKGHGIFYSLKDLARKICGLEIQRGNHNSLSDVKAIWKIYRKVEFRWIDHIFQKKLTAMLPESPKKIQPSYFFEPKFENRKLTILKEHHSSQLRSNSYQYFPAQNNNIDLRIKKYVMSYLRHKVFYHNNYWPKIRKSDDHYHNIKKNSANFYR